MEELVLKRMSVLTNRFNQFSYEWRHDAQVTKNMTIDQRQRYNGRFDSREFDIWKRNLVMAVRGMIHDGLLPTKIGKEMDKALKAGSILSGDYAPEIQAIVDFLDLVKIHIKEGSMKLITMKEEFPIPGTNFILEKGDRIRIKEGLADQMTVGREIEKEHLPTYEWMINYFNEHGEFPPFEAFTEHISGDHLDELKDYYTRLVAMEKEAGK